MATPDPVAVADADRHRVAADTGAAAALALRVAEATVGLADVRAQLSALLRDVDAAVGVGDPARAFRQGFSPAVAAAAESLDDAENRLDAHRQALVSGVDALLATDADASTRIGRGDVR
ncbi:hypothetical protein [Gordonia sp. HS-NH1]|uniref:hypothetical protein n=1 Tax=Gordonia sp. HS-NH1 TaxID=1435068 RepID=UPI0006E13534|nr:hypothetical protein [Gordonia sp. HS-NH1]